MGKGLERKKGGRGASKEMTYGVGEAIEGGLCEHGESTVVRRIARLQTDDVIDQVFIIFLKTKTTLKPSLVS